MSYTIGALGECAANLLGVTLGKFITATFLLLGWAFYELSGGADFVPEAWPEVVAEAPAAVATPAVTRSATSDLVNISLPVTAPAPPPDAPEVTVAAVLEEVVEAPTPEPEEEVVANPEPAPLDMRYVAGSLVNLRDGPGTAYLVLDQVPGGTQAEVLEVDASGWARIRVPSRGSEGWMAERLLTY